MLKHFVEILYPGTFFCESSEKEVKDRNPDKVIIKEKSAFAFRFFDREERVQGNESLRGLNKNFSGIYYLPGGKIYTLKDVILEFPDQDILIDNMKINKMEKVIKTRVGNFQPFNKNDVLLQAPPKKLKFRG